MSADRDQGVEVIADNVVGQACVTGGLRWAGGRPGNENWFLGSSVLVYPTRRRGGVLQPPWRSAMPSLQQPLEGRRQLPNVCGLYPGTADLPDRMAGPVGPEGFSSSMSGFQP